MQGVILAAGQGKRLQSLTLKRSKAMLPILGKPVVARVMDQMAAAGIIDFLLVISPNDHEIREFFQQHLHHHYQVQLVEQPQPHGMTDALRYARPFIQDDFLLSACDNLMHPEFTSKLLLHWNTYTPLDGLLTLMEIEIERLGSVGMVEMEGLSVRRIVEKAAPGEVASNLSSLPLYCFSHRLLDYLDRVPLSKRGEYELQDAIQLLIDHGGQVEGIQAKSRLTLTNLSDLLAINLHYLSQNPDLVFTDPSAQVDPGARLWPPVWIGSGVKLLDNCQVGPYAYIEADSQVSSHAHISQSVILRRVKIAEGRQVVGEVVY